MAISGRAGSSSAAASASSSATSSGPAQAMGAKRATPWVEAWARCALPKASMTKTSQSDAMFFASRSSSSFSPALKRTFSYRSSGSSPASSQSTSGTWRPRSSPSARATGASE